MPSPAVDLSTFQVSASLSRSPYGPWEARIASFWPASGDQAHNLLKLVNWQENREIIVVDEWFTAGLGAPSPVVMRWAQDGSKVFVADSGSPDGCGPRWIEKPRRVDLTTGDIVALAIDPKTLLSISPDGQSYLSFDDNALHLLDLESGAELAKVPLTLGEDAQRWIGEPVWSPDGKALLFTLQVNPCTERAGQAIYFAGLQRGASRRIVEPDERDLAIASWPIPEIAQLRDKEGHAWWLDMNTSEVLTDPPADIAQAQAALYGYFEALAGSRYAEAAHLYGGEYDILVDDNPDVAPDDDTTLWQHACSINGFQCLPVESAVLLGIDEGHYTFRVSFLAPDGSTFKRGPCCGAGIVDMPPEWEFTYSVMQSPDGQMRVQDLPVYVP